MTLRAANRYHQFRDGFTQANRSWCRASWALAFGRGLLLVTAACTCFSSNSGGQTSDSQSLSSKSWTTTTDSTSDNSTPTRIPTRITERHTRKGALSLDERSVQIRGSDGRFETYQEIEKETVQVGPDTVRIAARTFARDVNGARSLVQVTEEERRTLPSGDSHVVRVTSNPDVNGKLEPVQREILETKRVSSDTEETNSIVMLPSANGLVPARKTLEVRKEGTNERAESKKTTWLPDVNGEWQLSEIQTDITQQVAGHRIKEERVSRLGAEGKMEEVSRVVSDEADSEAEGRQSIVKRSYSMDVPGATRDGSLHLVERATVAQRTSPNGERVTQRTVEQADPGDPGAGLHVSILVNETMVAGPSGEESTVTIRGRDANGNVGVVEVDTTKSDKGLTIQIEPSPSATPR
jgi:hypothetical protein